MVPLIEFIPVPSEDNPEHADRYIIRVDGKDEGYCFPSEFEDIREAYRSGTLGTENSDW